MPELYARLLRMYTEATSMTQLSDIVRTDPDILGGTPVFVGTRVPIQSLFDYLEGGETLDEFLRQFPSVRRDQAIAALDLARATLLASARSSWRAAAARPCRCAPRPPCPYRGRPWLDGHHERRASAAHGRRVRRAGHDGPGIEFQQNLTSVAVGVLLVRASSNRMVHLQPLVPAILDALPALKPGQLHRIGG